MALIAGSRVGPYEVVALLGAGGMGEVYRAHDAKLGRDVALKILPALFTNDPDRLARFRREAQVLASLNHSNIGHIYGFEDSGAQQALVLELVDGPTLADRIAQGPIPLDEALPIARQIADALEAAHEHGVVHRDLKPANVKVRDEGTVKVLDFGLAKALDPISASGTEAMNSPTLTGHATQLGVIIGTAAYMAPEQARGKAADRRADVWAFGVVLYEMLTGRPAFGGETITDVMASIVQREPDWTRLPSATPARIHRLLRRCLEKDPRRRIRDIADARLDLVDAIEGRPEIGGSPATAEARRRSRGLAWWAAAATVAALLLAALRWLVPPAPPARVVTRLDVASAPTSEPGSFALSPDGRQLVFAGNSSTGVQQLWLRSMDQTTARQLPGTDDAIQPFWAPEGRSIGFFAGGRLKRLDLGTGLTQILAVAPAARGGTWSRGDVIVYAPSTATGLMRVSAAPGGQASPITQKLPGQYSQRWPQFLPDGRRFLFSTFLGQPESRGLYLASLDDGTPRRLLTADEAGSFAPLYAPPGFLLMVRQSVLLARRFDPDHPEANAEALPIAENLGADPATFRASVSASMSGVLAHRTGGIERRQLVWMDRSGRILGRVGAPDDNALSYPSLSPDGRHVAVSRVVDGNGDLWIIDVARGTQRRFSTDPSQDLAPLWSPDGSQIAFRSARQGSYDLFIKSTTGPDDEQKIVVDGNLKSWLDWSSDGRTILYVSLDPVTAADVWAYPIGGDRKPFPVLRTPFDEVDAHFSPDGRWIVYRSNESGPYEIYVRPFPGPGNNQLVSTKGGQQPRWSRDGKDVFYLSPGGEMMAAAVKVSSDGRSITSGPPVALFPVRIASGTYVTTAGAAGRGQYDIARDGRFLLNVGVDDYAQPPISVVLNWDALMKK
jgi:Tol biopolymer transport system component